MDMDERYKIELYKKDGYAIIPGRIVAVYPASDYERDDGTTYHYRNMIALFRTKNGEWTTYKVTVSGDQTDLFDKFKRGDIVLIRMPVSLLERDRPPINEDKKRIYIWSAMSVIKGGEAHEEYYGIPPIENIDYRKKKNYVTLKKVKEDIENDPENVTKNWYNSIVTVYKFHAMYPYVSKKDKHGIVIRLGIEDHSGNYLRAKTFKFDPLIDAVGLTIEDVENKLEQIKKKISPKDNPNKELANVLTKLTGKYFDVTFKVAYDERINEWIANIIKIEPITEDTIEDFIKSTKLFEGENEGGDEQ